MLMLHRFLDIVWQSRGINVWEGLQREGDRGEEGRADSLHRDSFVFLKLIIIFVGGLPFI